MLADDILTFKVLSKIVSDGILIFFFFFFFFFRENKTWHFMWIVCQADDSHMLGIIFSEIKKIKMLSTEVVINALRLKLFLFFLEDRVLHFIWIVSSLNKYVKPCFQEKIWLHTFVVCWCSEWWTTHIVYLVVMSIWKLHIKWYF